MPLRLAILGAGSWATQHIAAIGSLSDAELVAIADRSVGRAEDLAARHAIPQVFPDSVALLDQARPDAVAIVTPSPTHAELTTACAERGIAVLVEKPIAQPNQADSMRRAAAAVPVMPGHVLRFGASYVALAERAHGTEGPLRSLIAQRHRGVDHITSYPETHIVDLTMIHDLDLALWLLAAPIAHVRGWCAVPTTAAPQLVAGAAPALVQAELTTTDGRVALLRASWLLPADSGQDLLVAQLASGATVEIGNPELGHTGHEIQPVDIAQAMSAQWHHFADCVRRAEPPTRVTVEDALTGLRIAAAIKESAAADGAPVMLDQD